MHGKSTLFTVEFLNSDASRYERVTGTALPQFPAALAGRRILVQTGGAAQYPHAAWALQRQRKGATWSSLGRCFQVSEQSIRSRKAVT